MVLPYSRPHPSIRPHSLWQPDGCPSRLAAEQRLKELVAHYAKTAPKLAAWLEENLPQGFTVFTLPAAHQQRMRTSNALERVNQERKRAPAWPASSPMKNPSCA